MDFPQWIKNLPFEQHQFLSFHLESKTCDIYFSEIEQGTFISEHLHDNTVLNFVAEGSVTIAIEGKTVTYTTGSWCEIPRNTTHTLKADTKARLIELWLKS
jgi:quercetin dioxygenase-like cupin family protein